MKKNFFGLLVIVLSLSWACTTEKTNTVKISGTIENPSSDSIWIRFNDPIEETESYAAALDSMGNFELSFNLLDPSEATFFDGKETSTMFLNPGDDLKMNLNTEEFDESISYEGKGSCANNYLVQYYLKFVDSDGPNPYKKVSEMDTYDAMDFVDSLYSEQKKDFETYLKENDCPKAFKEWMTNNMIFSNAALYNSIYYAEFRKVNYQMDSLELPEAFHKTFKSYAGMADTGLPSSVMYNHLRSYFYYLTRHHSDRFAENAPRDSVNILLIKENFPQKYGQIQLTSYLLREFNSLRTDAYENNLESIQEYITDESLIKKLSDEHQAVIDLMASGVPENANVIDLNMEKHEDVSFQDVIDKYKGKVIYLDFWASWCGPCKAEMPYSKKLKEKLDTDEVAFVYLSTDRDSTSWINMIKKLELEGDQYRLSSESRKQSMEMFDVRYIPRYIVYDKEGMVVDSTAPRPSDPKSFELLESLL